MAELVGRILYRNPRQLSDFGVEPVASADNGDREDLFKAFKNNVNQITDDYMYVEHVEGEVEGVIPEEVLRAKFEEIYSRGYTEFYFGYTVEEVEARRGEPISYYIE